MCAQDRCGSLPECDVYLWCPANLHQLRAPITPALCYEVSINGASGQPHGGSTVHYPAQKCPAFPLLCAKVSSSSHDGVSPTRSPTGPSFAHCSSYPLKERCHLCCLPHFLMSSFPRRKEWRYVVEAHPLSTFPLHHVETSYNLVVRTVSRGHKTSDICT